nr:cyclopropane-fatty-acyl-phospholipid synthase family protein [Streptomonospora litoralis]
MLVPALDGLFAGGLPVRVRAWDGSEAGPRDAVTVVLNRPEGLRRILARPGELGLARAYVSGDVDVAGDLADGLRRVYGGRRDRGAFRPTPAALARAARVALALQAVGPPPPPPASEARLRGRRHTLRRDAAAVSHHYDAGNDLYRLLLDPSMAYSCAYWEGPDATLAEAQDAKLELICTKLALRPGSRLLDVGCGWGSLALYAAERHGARVTAVTLSAQQAEFVRRRVAERGLGDLVTVHLGDYREIGEGAFDAVAAVEMGEHVGRREYRAFAARLRSLLAPQARLLVQQMSRRGRYRGGGPFIESYIAPDMHMRPVGETVACLEGAGLEVRDVHALREHYVHTARAWSAELERRWAEAVELAGEGTARVWRLYLAGGALSFEEGRMGVDQILAVRPDASGGSGMPASRRERVLGG